MGLYDLPKPERDQLVAGIHHSLLNGILSEKQSPPASFSDNDTYIRKSAYLAIGRIYKQYPLHHGQLLKLLNLWLRSTNEKVRQTTINAAGEIGMKAFDPVEHFFDAGLFDTHHIVRNAVIGSVKKMGAQNPVPVLTWAKKYLHHPDKEVRREICHGIELRGRTHPQDILPLLRELQFDTTARVRNTLVHVIGQIAYKKGCLATVIAGLQTWEHKELVSKALDEIIDVHHRYRNFATLTQAEAIGYIQEHYR